MYCRNAEVFAKLEITKMFENDAQHTMRTQIKLL